MPGSYLIDVPRNIVFSRGWGVLTDAEIMAHVTALRADSRFAPGFRQLVDFRELTAVHVTGTVVKRAARQNPFPRDARRVFVVSLDVAFGMTRMLESYMGADANQFEIFRTIEPALQWVGLDAATPWPTQAPDVTFGVP